MRSVNDFDGARGLDDEDGTEGFSDGVDAHFAGDAEFLSDEELEFRLGKAGGCGFYNNTDAWVERAGFLGKLKVERAARFGVANRFHGALERYDLVPLLDEAVVVCGCENFRCRITWGCHALDRSWGFRDFFIRGRFFRLGYFRLGRCSFQRGIGELDFIGNPGIKCGGGCDGSRLRNGGGLEERGGVVADEEPAGESDESEC